MELARSCGLLLHPTSLPGRFGVGDLGPAAYHFVDFLVTSGQKIWQVLPLGPTGYGDSPFQLFSVFAGNPLLVSLEKLAEDGLLEVGELEAAPEFPPGEVDYGRLIPFKIRTLRQAYARFAECAGGEFETFCGAQAWWLDDYALFMSLKHAQGEEAVWCDWDEPLARRRPEALRACAGRFKGEIEFHQFIQFEFFRQWSALRRYANSRGVRLFGDLPIYVAHDSADVWSQQQFFKLDKAGRPETVAGVPPDYFSDTGQLWGNPIYRWDRMQDRGYTWWTARLKAQLALVDLLRLDHFRGFEAYWEVPSSERTAINGRWSEGPGAGLFLALKDSLGELPLVAENLGVITAQVEALRKRFGFPGMAILQFAFGTDPQAPSFQPHNYPRDLVAYTGTHDNDTTVGWWTSGDAGASTRSKDELRREREFARRYLATDGSEINWVFIRALMASAADTVIIPVQDVLGLGSEARMNVPGRATGNWRWRCPPSMLTSGIAGRLAELAGLYGR